MKLLAVVFCAGLLSISAAAVSDNLFGLSLQPTAQAVSSSLPYSRHKRQVEDFDQLRRCLGIFQDQLCNNGLLQEGIDLIFRCNLASLAVTIQDSCRRNSNGLYCDLASTYVNEVNNIETTCATALTSGCTAQCSNLLMLIRSELGCCINLVFNSTANVFFSPEAFSNSLWTTCGVAPVTETCSSPISLDTTIDIDPNCDIAEERIELICARRFLEPIFDALEDAGDCQAYLGATMELCGVNEEGEWCSNLDRDPESSHSQLLRTQHMCSLSNTTCTEECMQALQNISDVGGCCANSFFNGSLTLPRYDFLSFEFWSNCGVDTLGTCEVRLIDATTQPNGTTTPSDGAVNSNAGMVLGMLMVFLSLLYYHRAR